MPAPASAFVLVGVEMIAGTFSLMWMTMLAFKDVSRGFYRSTTWVLAPLMALITLGLGGDVRTLGWVFVALMGTFLASVYTQRPLLEWIAGGAAVVAGLALAAAAGAQACGWCAGGPVQVLAGALFAGAVTHGMVLGHWYLNQPRLPIEPLVGATRVIFFAIAVALVSGFAGRGGLIAGGAPPALVAAEPSSYWWVWLFLVAGCGLLALMIRSTVRARSNQSATGLLYVAMVPAIGSRFVLDLLLAA